MSKRKPYGFSDVAVPAPKFWSSLEAKREPAKYESDATAEFPGGVGLVAASSDAEAALQQLADASAQPTTEEAKSRLGRRSFLTVAATATAAFGIEGCIRRDEDHILPYAQAPEYLNPGVPMHFASVLSERGEAIGVVVESHEGRPTKIEGNPEHPASLGGSNLRLQAQIMELYDPDRSKSPTAKDGDARATKTFADFDAFLATQIATYRGNGGEGLRFLSEPTNSPSFLRLRQAVLRDFPRARFHTWTGAHRSRAREGARLAFGSPVEVHVDFTAARAIVAIDSDFLGTEPGNLIATTRFAAGRRLGAPTDEMSRLYVVEPTMTVTGSNADHRLRLPARDAERYLRGLADALVRNHALDLGPVTAAVRGASTDGIPAQWLEGVAADLAAHRGRSAIVVGTRQPAKVHALAHAINSALDNVGRTVALTPPVDPEEQDAVTDIAALAGEVTAVKTLVILSGNPALDAPTELGFAEKLAGIETSIHLGVQVNETARAATWHVPASHELETWGDQRATEGTVAVQQPLIAPLFGGRSPIEILALFAGVPNWRGHYVVRETVRGLLTGGVTSTITPFGPFEQAWRRALHRGVVDGTAAAPVTPTLRGAEIATALGESPAAKRLSADDAEIAFSVDAKLLDGRSINNPWLLELPDPISKLTWDNVAYLSPHTASELGVYVGDHVEITRGDASITIPAWILPGQADFSVGLTFGWGRSDVGRYGSGAGTDTLSLRRADGDFADGVRIRKAGGHTRISQTQEHHRMEGRPIAIDATLEQYREHPDFAIFRSPTPRTLPLWQEVDYRGHKWGMTIDLNSCTGCEACMVACIAENNTPIVGREMVARGREMHWIRVDRYFTGEDENAPDGVAYQPVMCQQCEEAPCENVCPVNATAHSPEGLNDMAYNRCIGTRYCMNNCPYKVRRFNYLNWNETVPETERMAKNPNVTVRFRGVMEKCTYCVQRIEQARIATRVAGRDLRDGDIVTACQQACPAKAIMFGDLNDPQSRVTQLAASDRQYKLLGAVGTQPRTTYLAKVRNPNPAMAPRAAAAAAEEHGA